MKTKNKFLITITFSFISIGFALIFGSIASFIAMNVVAPNPLQPDNFVIWQRFFIAAIMNCITIPAIVLFLLGNGLLLFLKGLKKKTVALFFLSLTICINGLFFIVPKAYKVNALAVSENVLKEHWTLFLTEKVQEDVLGGINMLLLLTYLFFIIYLIISNSALFFSAFSKKKTQPLTHNS